ncbi:carboxymuconolactone decarboxylase family protein [Nocardiopsis sp. CT-R113]|uniref:Carboxymuconolactone decarboxylase family protein n=1 Tax=Nocardiopsis codii TaxID=3065942 RepID=A0ABU7KCN7_9ACTN|nr:carboxymuconolactone decarboxylase family protein [Nocardiopsis sp. CT-R113]MEE2040001.1 carboxymuconolactone decarboxylase family protein [Nocardiopsis sp. CT-R113]
MEARINLFGSTVATKVMKHVAAVDKVLRGTTVSTTTQELVKIRVSQINGCGFCTDMHTKEATLAGETPVRLHLIAVWREATVFTEAERAALELAEQGTRVADAAGGVPDEVWETAAKHYDEDELAALVCLISFMNSVNRMNLIAQNPAGDYQPGQFG